MAASNCKACASAARRPPCDHVGPCHCHSRPDRAGSRRPVRKKKLRTLPHRRAIRVYASYRGPEQHRIRYSAGAGSDSRSPSYAMQIYRELAAAYDRTRQITAGVSAAAASRVTAWSIGQPRILAAHHAACRNADRARTPAPPLPDPDPPTSSQARMYSPGTASQGPGGSARTAVKALLDGISVGEEGSLGLPRIARSPADLKPPVQFRRCA
jgi:hypothetical protein